MGIISNSISLLSAKFISKLTPISSNLPIFSDLKQHNRRPKLLAGDFEGGCFSLLPTTTYSKDDSILFNFPRLGRYFIPIASCNELLLMYTNPRLETALWNPATDEVKKISEPFFLPRYTKMIYGHGLGFDHASQDYKVVRLFTPYDSDINRFQAGLYSLKTDSWKEITYRDEIHYPVPRVGDDSIHINGFYYWLLGKASIICFDFANEKFLPARIPLPKTDNLREKPFKFILAEIDGLLAAVVSTGHNFQLPFKLATHKPFEFEIWVWNDASWNRVPANRIPADVAVKQPLGLFGNDKLYIQDTKDDLLIFDCTTGVLKNLGLNTHVWRLCIYRYVESSFPLGGKKITRAWKS